MLLSKLSRFGKDGEVSVAITCALSADDSRKGTVKFAPSCGLKQFEAAIRKSIPGLPKLDFVIINNLMTDPKIISNDADILTITRRDNIYVIPKKVAILVKTADQDPTSYQVDVVAPVSSVIEQITEDTNSEKYLLCIPPRGRQTHVFTCCPTMSLASQGWYFDTITMIRRVYIDDILDPSDHDLRKRLLQNCRLAAYLNLSYYTPNVWAKLTALQLVYEQVQKPDVVHIKKNLWRYVSPAFKDDERIVQMALLELKKLSTCTPDEAELLYLQTAAEGCQCAFVEKVFVRSRLPGLRKKEYYLMISARELVLMKDFPGVAEMRAAIETCDGVSSGDDGIRIRFINEEPWSFVVSQPDVIFGIISQFTNKAFDCSSPQKESPQSPIPEQPQEQGEDEYLIGRSMSFDDDLQAAAKRENDDLTIEATTTVTRRKFVLPGWCGRVGPPESEKDAPYSFSSEISDLEIIEKLNPEKPVLQERREIDLEKFFELPQNEMWYNSKFLIALIIILVYSFLRK